MEKEKVYSIPVKKLQRCLEKLKARGKNIPKSQVCLYPLRTRSLTPYIHRAKQIFEEFQLDIFPRSRSMSTKISGGGGRVWSALYGSFVECAKDTDLVMTATISNACPPPVSEK